MSQRWQRAVTAAKAPIAAAPWISSPAPKPRKPAKPPSLPEWLLQASMVAEFNAIEAAGAQISAVGDMNAGRRSYQEAAKCKAMGMRSGEPDLRLYASGGRTLFIEVKTSKGRKSAAQDERHTRLGQLGFQVLVVAPTDETHARLLAREIASKFCDGGMS